MLEMLRSRLPKAKAFIGYGLLALGLLIILPYIKLSAVFTFTIIAGFALLLALRFASKSRHCKAAITPLTILVLACLWRMMSMVVVVGAILALIAIIGYFWYRGRSRKASTGAAEQTS